MTAPRIAVLASLGRNPVSGAPRPNREDVLALELARRIGGDITLLHAGAPDSEALRDYLAYGAERIDITPSAKGEDPTEALAPSLAGFDLVLAGSRSEGGEGSGLVPYRIAERLGLPVVAQAVAIRLDHGTAEILQLLPKGQRRRVRVNLPAVIVVHRAAAVTPRFAYARRLAGRIAQRPAPDTPPSSAPVWRTELTPRAPIQFRAVAKQPGHSRLLSAIATVSKGGTLVSDGTPADKAQAILAYLRQHRLIDW